MGKNRDRESLIRTIVNTIVHEIVLAHTNRLESKNFLNSEIIEYRSQAEKKVKEYTWNNEDISYINEKSLEKIGERLKAKYTDVSYSEDEIKNKLKDLIKEIISSE